MMTFGTYAESWIASRVKLRIWNANTQQAYEYAVSKLVPIFGTVPLTSLTRPMVEAAYAKLLNDGLSPTTVRFLRGRAKAICATAIEDGLLTINPFKAPKCPKGKGAKVDTIQEAALKRFLHAMKGEGALGSALRFAALTGVRRGELVALKWDDIEWAKKRVHIKRNLVQNKITCQEMTPKSRASFRTISLPDDLFNELVEAHKTARCEYVFPAHGHEVDRRRSLNAFSQETKAVLRKHGLGSFSLHDLRHAHATMLLQHKHNPKAVSQRLGHSDVTITLRTYGHVFEKDDEDLAACMNTLTEEDA